MHCHIKVVLVAFCAALWAAALASSAAVAQSGDKFYEGKTIRIIVALGTGGDYDNYARIAARHLGKYIPGSPTIVVQNMPGAGGLLAANHLANVAPKDGTVIGALHANTTLAQVTGAPNVEYDVRKLNWIGRTSSGGLNVHHTFAKSGVKSFDDLLKREVVVGGGGPTSDSIVIPTAVNELMGTKLKILGGYSGTAETTLALERGEIDMAMQNWEFLRRNNADWIKEKKINLIVQYGTSRHPELPDVPDDHGIGQDRGAEAGLDAVPHVRWHRLFADFPAGCASRPCGNLAQGLHRDGKRSRVEGRSGEDEFADRTAQRRSARTADPVRVQARTSRDR